MGVEIWGVSKVNSCRSAGACQPPLVGGGPWNLITHRRSIPKLLDGGLLSVLPRGPHLESGRDQLCVLAVSYLVVLQSSKSPFKDSEKG